MATNQSLSASRREEFTRASLRQLREGGRIPAVIYGAQTESLPIHVDAKDLAKVSRTGRSEFFDLKVEGGETYPALIKEIQQRRGVVAHVDFQKVSKNKPIRVKVPLHLTGTAEGTKAGGVLQVQATELEVEGLPDDLPANIEVDISSLGTGDKLTAADVSLPSGITLIGAEEELLASIVLPRVVEEEVDTGTGAESAETAGEETEGDIGTADGNDA
ncbi:50S ribosomal protein L25 [Paenibacillus sp. Marseille-P2973]|uniref:Large ribosomal subunit protein bL25 n=2 Tax=Paenibacillus TaxID=44249 RepID=A0ABQ4MEE1_9BACL|nr:MULTISPECIES: 50S ribosomal protein L25 [Paenibacillus]MBQ4897799.1 50S ribosomal protein L25 [Paenibacillus sp. Marseille-P2973]MDN4067173.1 50S ribosomal protein L25 [Paenibacillus vini]GIP54323.1 general stress protein CTC [Paenibacillus vini]